MTYSRLEFNDIEYQGEKYIVIGEMHEDEMIGKEVIYNVVKEFEIDNFYAEVLYRDSKRDWEDLKPESEVYGYYHNPEKFDCIFNLAEEQGMQIHGLESRRENRKGDGRHRGKREYVRDWAKYILETSKETNLILSGFGHITGWDENNLIIQMMERGAKRSNFLSISTLELILEEGGKGLEEGIYSFDGLPKELDGKFLGEETRFGFMDNLHLADYNFLIKKHLGTGR
ncbi:MAG: hypothetical protein SVV03_04810 [Candidatus Nanohaloarchaea archaeon]|nr:hypothetical protein [Candidatus Nanohaloarchaea archaeon]